MSMTDYGGITVSKHHFPDGKEHYEITHADELAGISVAILDMDAGEHFRTDDDGNLVILGQLTYRPVRFDQDGRIIVCERIT